MPGSYVVDASVAAKLYFTEAGSEQAEAAVRAADRLVAPDFLFLEMASLAAKKVRRSVCSIEQAADAVESLTGLLDEAFPSPELASRAFALAAAHGFSAYDAAYLALAERTGAPVLTADAKLVRRAKDAGLGEHAHALIP